MLWAEGHVKRLARHPCYSDPTFSAGSKSLVRKLAQAFVPAEIVLKPSQTSYSTKRYVRQNRYLASPTAISSIANRLLPAAPVVIEPVHGWAGRVGDDDPHHTTE
jgi:hypothetical protein